MLADVLISRENMSLSRTQRTMKRERKEDERTALKWNVIRQNIALIISIFGDADYIGKEAQF